MINQAKFTNFKNLADVTVDLEPFTLLVGPNGAGKTSVLQGIYLLSQLCTPQPEEGEYSLGRLRAVFKDAWAPPRLYRQAVAAEMVLSMSRGIRLEVGFKGQDPLHWRLSAGHPNVSEQKGSGSLTDQALVLLQNWLGIRSQVPFRVGTLLQLNAAELARPVLASLAAPPPWAPGQGLAGVINYYAGAYPDAKVALDEAVRQIVPQFKRVLVEPISFKRPDGELGGHRLVVEMDTGRIPADQVSEGTLLALGLAAVVHHPQRPKLLLIDDIDRGLHLGAQVRLMQVLRALMAQDPELQIIATTHSPFLLQEAQAQEVRVMGLGPQGPVCRKLTEHPDFERMKTFMGTGEIWAALGEDWVGQ